MTALERPARPLVAWRVSQLLPHPATFPCCRVLSRCPKPICGAFSISLWCGDVDPIYRSAVGHGYQGFPFISYGFPNITYKNFASDITGIKAVFNLKQGFLNGVCIRITCRVCLTQDAGPTPVSDSVCIGQSWASIPNKLWVDADGGPGTTL